MNVPSSPIPGEPAITSLQGLASDANSKLESTINESTNQAFNLGCVIGLLPAIIFAVVIFLATGFSLIGAAMAIVLGIVSAIAFANLAAMITRRNTMNRAYRERIDPEIERSLKIAGASRDDFDRVARQVLSSSDPLFHFIRLSEEPTSDLTEGEA